MSEEIPNTSKVNFIKGQVKNVLTGVGLCLGCEGMRVARIKVDAVEAEAVYHCMTRTVNGERLFDERAREVLRKQLWQVADYCGVEILTYAILCNHFHVLVRVPRGGEVGDEELLRRYRVLYPKPTRYQQGRIEVIRERLKEAGDPEGEAWRQRQRALMGDVSAFMKLVKQRFSIWYNRSHQRFGTLWAERFKSVLVESAGRAVLTVAAYIDLNAVRANIVKDPREYRFCGYGEAVGGNGAARAGLGRITGLTTWAEIQGEYRQMLFGVGAGAREAGSMISAAEAREVMRAKGQLPLAAVLRCRLRYFTDGAVLGSQEFVAGHIEDYRRRHGRRKGTGPRPLPELTDWGGLATLRGLRKKPFG